MSYYINYELRYEKGVLTVVFESENGDRDRLILDQDSLKSRIETLLASGKDASIEEEALDDLLTRGIEALFRCKPLTFKVSPALKI